MDEFFGRIFFVEDTSKDPLFVVFFRNSTIIKDIFNFMRVSVVLGDMISSDFLRTEGCISLQNSDSGLRGKSDS